MHGKHHCVHRRTLSLSGHVRLPERCAVPLRCPANPQPVPALRGFSILHDRDYGGLQTWGNVSPASFLVLLFLSEHVMDHYPIYVCYPVFPEIGVCAGAPG